MKKIYLFFLFLGVIYTVKAQPASEIKIYTDFLDQQHCSAKEYIFRLFEKYDIVILCERDHRDITQYGLLLEIFKDKRFTKEIKNAYFEIGNNVYNDTLNAFLKNSHLTPRETKESVLSFQRNSYGAPLWEKANYAYYLKEVHNINKNLPEEEKISIHGLDIGINWQHPTVEDLRKRDSLMPFRDSIIGNLFLNYFDRQNTSKALVVLNYRHAFLRDLLGRVNAGRFIANAHKGKVANVFLNSFILSKNANNPDHIALIHDGQWDAAFFKAGKNDLGFDFANSPFGQASCDMIPVVNNFKYSDIFTGFIYYQYIMDVKTVTGIKNYIDDQFGAELMERYKLEQKLYQNQLPDIEDLKKEYNTVTEETYRQQYPYLQKDIDKWLK